MMVSDDDSMGSSLKNVMSIGDDKTECNENGGSTTRKAMIARRNVQFHCHEIMEPDDDDGEDGGNKHLERINSILVAFQQSIQRSKLNLGYALNHNYDYSALDGLPNFGINNFGDPFIESNYYGHSKQFEVAVLDWFARLWEIEKDDYWGYVTNGGTEANLHAFLLARELFPDGILYASKESHFCVFKAARMYRMDCVRVETLISGAIDCADFKAHLLQNTDKPAIINVNIGTTMKGAVDDLDLVIQTLEECGYEHDRFYIHCDGAMYGLMLPLLKEAPRLTFKKPIGSISVSGHKFIGCTMPCGIQMTRIKHVNVISRDVEYIASRDISISCSRNGHSPVYLWYVLSQKGYRGFQQDFYRCLSNAKHLKDLLVEAGVSVMLNELSSVVVFERPPDEDFIRRWQLSCEGNIAHVVVMPIVTIEKLNTFYHELVEKRAGWFKDGGEQPPCVATQIGKGNCVCAKHKGEILPCQK